MKIREALEVVETATAVAERIGKVVKKIYFDIGYADRVALSDEGMIRVFFEASVCGDIDITAIDIPDSLFDNPTSEAVNTFATQWVEAQKTKRSIEEKKREEKYKQERFQKYKQLRKEFEDKNDTLEKVRE